MEMQYDVSGDEHGGLTLYVWNERGEFVKLVSTDRAVLRSQPCLAAATLGVGKLPWPVCGSGGDRLKMPWRKTQ